MQKLTDTQLLAQVLNGDSQSKIAADNQMTVTQINRRVNSKDFQALLTSTRKIIIHSAFTKLTTASLKAVDTLTELLDSPNVYVRLGSAKSILQATQDYSVTVDLMSELEEIRQNQNQILNDVDVDVV